IQSAEMGFAEVRGACEDRFKDGFEIGGRSTDDTEDVARCSLLLKRLLRLIEQSGGLDRYDSLVGEGLQQVDLLLAERSHLSSVDRDTAYYPTAFQHRDDEIGPHSADVGRRKRYGISFEVSRRFPHIRYLH